MKILIVAERRIILFLKIACSRMKIKIFFITDESIIDVIANDGPKIQLINYDSNDNELSKVLR